MTTTAAAAERSVCRVRRHQLRARRAAKGLGHCHAIDRVAVHRTPQLRRHLASLRAMGGAVGAGVGVGGSGRRAGRRVEEGEQKRLELARHLVLDRRAERVPVAHRVLVPQRRRLRRVAAHGHVDKRGAVGAKPLALAGTVQPLRVLRREAGGADRGERWGAVGGVEAQQ